jgi:hypothetical protein
MPIERARVMAKPEWRSAPAQRGKYFDGPRISASIGGGCKLEVFEDCSNRRGTCPSGAYSYVVVVKRGVVKAAGPHSQPAPKTLTQEQAKHAAYARATRDPKLKCR